MSLEPQATWQSLKRKQDCHASLAMTNEDDLLDTLLYHCCHRQKDGVLPSGKD